MSSLGVLITTCAVGGVLVGSFLNVVAWRLPRGESVLRPASRCPRCGHAIRARDNVPVIGWILLRGRCRDCSARISPRYPAVEAVTGLTFGLIAWRLGFDWALPAFLYLSGVGIALALIDFDTRRLPNSLTLPSYLIGGGLLTAAGLLDGQPQLLLHAAIGMAVLYALYFVLMIAKPGGMGFGDVKLAGVVGLYLGYLGWGPLAVGAFAAFLLGGLVGAGLLLFGEARRKTKIPFGPYMVVGALVAVLAGSELAHLYVHAVGG